MAVKIDLEKAYDRVNWSFLAGFSRALVELIMFSVTTASMSIIWNGNRLQSFRLTRGIRQGDPLAPYFFVLYMDVLSQNIKAAVDRKRWCPISVSRGGPSVSHIFFADDLLLFGSATCEQADIMADVLRDFCTASGQKISYGKSQFFVSRNTRRDVVESIAGRLNMKCTDDLGKYLGMPVIHGRVTSDIFDFLLDNLRDKLNLWSSKTLSQAGRALLIKSVLTAIPSYVMQTLRIPTAVIKEMEKIIRRFFWAEVDGTKHMHFLAWDRICQAKNRGGLGIRRLAQMNTAFLMKLGWALLTEPNKLWVQILQAKYGSPVDISTRQDVSLIWRSIRSCRSILLEGMGRNTGEAIPQDSETRLRPRWEAENSGKFSVTSANLIQTSTTEAIESQAWHRIWNLKGPSRANFFLWRMRHDVLPTTCFLFRRHISQTFTCAICGASGVEPLHDVRNCGWMDKVWRLLVAPERWEEFRRPRSCREWVDMNMSANMGTRVTTLGWRYIFREVAYGGWFWRNQVVHNTVDTLLPPSIFVKEAMTRVRLLFLAHNVDLSLFFV